MVDVFYSLCVCVWPQKLKLYFYLFIFSYYLMTSSAGHIFSLTLLCTFAFFPGTPINKPPVLGYKDLNLFKLFRLVHIHGGCDNVSVLSVPTICLLYSASGK